MVHEAPECTPAMQGVWCRNSGPTTACAGLLLPRCRPGNPLQKGEVIAELRSIDGQTLELLRASEACRLLSLPQRCWMDVGVSSSTVITKEETCFH